MKKKRILLGAILSTLALALSACDFLPSNFMPNRKNSSSSEESSQRSRSSRTPSSSEHVHTFSEEWSYNSASHWHNSTCGHAVKSDLASHDFFTAVLKEATCTSEGEQVQICSVCDYQRTYTIPTTEHTWFETSRIEPTCYESGVSRRYCTKCGLSSDVELPPLGHQFVTIAYRAPTCSERGYSKSQCSRCGLVSEYEIETTPHSWGATYSVEGRDGYLSYTTQTCRKCGANRIAIRALDGLLTGSYKSSIALDFGYIKLASNGNSVTYRFDYNSNAYGKMYQHGCFDSNSYYGYTYRTGVRDSSPYNFEINLNGAVVDMSQSGDIPYEQFFDGEGSEENIDLINNGFSRVNNCLIGDITLAQGTNTFTYTRIGSYNICVDYFVFEVINSDHVHTVSPEWNYDDTSHWHTCADVNCPVPNTRIDGATHTFGQKEVVVPVTCHSDGLDRETCTVCGYQRNIVIPSTGHIYEAVGSLEPAEGSVALDEYGCKTCDNYVLRWDAYQYDQSLSQYVDVGNSDYVRFQSGMAENRNGVEQTGAHLVYRINLPTALSNVGLAFYAAQSSSAAPIFDVYSQGSSDNGYIYENGELVQSTKKYGLRVNGVEIRLGEDQYGKNSSTSPKWYDWPVNFDLVAGINVIDVYCLSGSYRGRMYDFQITNIPYIEPNHTHTPGTEYSFDSKTHYHTCISGDGTKFDEESHQFGEYVTVTDSTCTEYGERVRTCVVCGYEEHQNISPKGHVWDEGVATSGDVHSGSGTVVYTCQVCGATKTIQSAMQHEFDESRTWYGVNSENVEYTMRYCSTCDKEVQSIPFANGTILSGGYSSGKLTSGTSMRWKFPARRTGLISVYIPCKMSSGNTGQTYDPSLYSISVNGVDAEILMPKGTYDELGIASSETRYFKWAEINISADDLVDGEIEITFTSRVQSYRMIFDGEFRLEY